MSITFYPAATVTALLRRLANLRGPSVVDSKLVQNKDDGLVRLRCKRCETKLTLKLPEIESLAPAIRRPINGHHFTSETVLGNPPGARKAVKNLNEVVRTARARISSISAHFECWPANGAGRKGKAVA